MLSSARLSAGRVQHTSMQRSPVGPMARVALRRGDVRPTKARALLWPQEQQRGDPLDAMINVVISWLEAKPEAVSTTEEAVPEYPMDDHEGHAGWGHSHIADRLATESSASQDFDL